LIGNPAYDVNEPGEPTLRNRQIDVGGARVAELLVRRGVRVEELHEQLAGLVVLTSANY